MKLKALILGLAGIVLISCDNHTSLQEYYVENQENSEFMALDIPASLLTGDQSALDEEQKATLKTIKKVNLIGYPISGENRTAFEEERSRITSILSHEKYQTLMKYGGGTRKAELYFTGEDDAIDELIIFGMDEEKGFGVARVLGDDMEPAALIKLVKSFEQGDLNIEGLEDILSLNK